jgi:hypothetical protein
MSINYIISNFKNKFKILDAIDLYQDAITLTTKLLSVKKNGITTTKEF